MLFELFTFFAFEPFEFDLLRRGEGRNENALLLLNGSFRLDDQPVRCAGCGCFGEGDGTGSSAIVETEKCPEELYL